MLESFCRQRRTLFYPKADLPVPDAMLRARGTPPAHHAADAVRAALGVTPRDVQPLAEPGTFHALYRAELPDRPVIVRLNVLHQQPDYLLHLDPWVAGRLREVGLPALAVHAVDLSRRHIPFDFEILEEARGFSLRSIDDDEDLLNPLLTDLGRFVARLHGVRTRGYGFLDVAPLVRGEPTGPVWGTCTTWWNYILRRLESHVSTCLAVQAIDRDETRRIYAAFAAAEGLLGDVQPSLLHGDLGSHNVFADDRDVTALIDWEDCLSGDPAFDVAFWATFHPERRHAAFLAGYAAQRPLAADFKAHFWLYFLRVALSKTVLRHRLGLTDRPGRAPASLRIQKGLERFEALMGGQARAA